jgi:DNA-binding NarL/FixJ family response regulator
MVSDALEAKPIRILLVDDDASFLNSLEALLTDEPGLEIVGKAASGQEALAAAARAEPDVAVIDLLMPTMSGIECAQLLQKRHPNARMILISGSIFEEKRPHPDERGTDAYLEKSEVPERLPAMILALAAETTAASPRRANAEP